MSIVFVGIGSNIAPVKHVQEGMAHLLELFPDCIFSDLYESESVGFDGDNFINLVAKFSTELSIAEVSKTLAVIEDASGRTRLGPKFSARTLDIDLLLFDDVNCSEPVELPRDEITKNAFVLLPLSEIAADFKHPVLKRTYAELWQQYPKNKQRLWRYSARPE